MASYFFTPKTSIGIQDATQKTTNFTASGSSNLNTLSVSGDVLFMSTTQLSPSSNTISGVEGAFNVSGDILFANATKNTLYFKGVGLGAPTFTTRSPGSKLILSPNISASTTDYAIGMETGNLWFSTPSASTGFKWYAGTTSIGNMDGGGNLTITGFVGCNRVSVVNSTPTAGSHLTSKTYVDGLGYLTAGTGLTKTSGTLSVNAAQTQITSVGTLTSLGVSGDVSTDANLIVNGVTDTTALGNGAAVLLGGMSVAKKIRTGLGLVVNAGGVFVNAGGVTVTGVSSFSNSLSCYALSTTAGGISVNGVSTFYNTTTFYGITCQNNLILQTEPTLSSHGTTKGYVDGVSYLTAGTGLTKTSATLSVNSSQTQITSVGTLTSLAVSGSSTFSGSIGVPSPTSVEHATPKSYVDDGDSARVLQTAYNSFVTTITSNANSRVLQSVYDSFVSSTSSALSLKQDVLSNFTYVATIDQNLSKASDVLFNAVSGTTGTFSGVVSGTSFTGNLIGGTLTATTGTFSGALSATGIQIPTGTGLFRTAGTTASYSLIGSNITDGPSNTRIVISGKDRIGFLGAIEYIAINTGNHLFFNAGSSTPSATISSTGITTAAFSGNLVGGSVSATTGTFTGAVSGQSFAGNLIGGTVSGTTGTFSGAVSGTSFTGNLIGGTLTATTGAFSGVMNVSNTTKLSTSSNTVSSSSGSSTIAGDLHLYHATNPQLVFATGTQGAPSFTTRSSGTRLIVYPNVSASSVDFALGVETSSFWFSTSQTSTSFKWYGGTTLAASLTGAGVLTLTAGLSATTGTFSGTVTVATPSTATHAATKAYVDGLAYLTAGTGLTLSGGSISVNAAQTQITSVGTLSSLAVTGAFSSGALTATTGTFSGAVTGTSFSGNLIGGTLTATTGSFSGAVTVPTPSATTHATTKAYVDGLAYLTAGTGLAKTGSTLSVNASQTQITDVGTLNSLSVNGILSTTTGNITINAFSRIDPGTSEVYSLTASSRNAFAPAGTVAKLVSDSNSIDGATLLDFSAPNTANGATGVYIGAVAGAGANSPANFVIGRRTGVSSWSESLRVNTNTTVSIWSTQDSSTSTTGALMVSGGLGVAKNLFVGQNISCLDPTISAHAATKNYVDALAYLTAGTGLTLTGGTLSVNAVQTQITSVGTLSSLAVTGALSSGALTATTGTFSGAVTTGTLSATSAVFSNDIIVSKTASGTGTTYISQSLIASGYGLVISGGLTQSVGPCWKLELRNSSSFTPLITGTPATILFEPTTTSSSTSTGSAVFSGGVGIQGALYGTTGSFSGAVTVPTPSATTHATTKAYVDGLAYLAAGTGVTLSGGSISVKATQTQITSVGTLSSLNVSGASVFSGSVTVPTPSATTDATNKAYVDGLATLVTAGTGLTKTGSTLSVNAEQTQITSVGTLSSLAVTGALSSGALTATTGTLTDTTDSSSSTSGSLVTNGGVGIAKNLYVNGMGSRFGLNLGNLTATAPVEIGCNAVYAGNQLATGLRVSNTGSASNNVSSTSTVSYNYVDLRLGSTSGGGFYGALSVGSGSTIVDALKIFIPSGTAAFSGAVTAPSFSGNLTGGTLSATTGSFSGAVTVPTPSATTDATNKAYVDGLTFITAGTGLTKTGGTLSVNAAQTQITSVGTLSSLAVTGALSSGALTATTGSFSGAVTVPTPSTTTHATTKAYVDGLTYLTSGTGLTLSGGSLSVNAAQTQITSVGTLSSLAVTGALSSGALTATTGTFSGISNVSNTTKLSTSSNTVSSSTGSSTIAGDLHLYHATNPQIVFFTGSTVAPSFTTRSAGTRLIIFPAVTASSTDYAIGMETSNMWFSTGATTTGFKWYGGTTLAGTLSGAGTLTLTSGLSATTGTFTSTAASSSVTTGALTVAGGAGVGGNLYVANLISSSTIATGAISGTTGNFSGDISTDTNLIVNGVTESTGVGTGAVVVLGGMSVAKRLRTNGGLVVNSGGLTVSSGGATVTTGGVNVTGVSTFNNTTTFFAIVCNNSLTVSGTAGFSGALTGPSFSGNLIGGTVSGTTGAFTGVVSIANTTDATSASSASLTSTGGGGFAGSVHVAGTTSRFGRNVGNLLATAPVEIACDATFSSNQLTTGLRLSNTGSVGNNVSGTTGSSYRCVDMRLGSTGSGQFYGTLSTGVGQTITDCITFSPSSTTIIGATTITSTTEATSGGVAALVSSGGLWVSKRAYIGGPLLITNSAKASTGTSVGNTVDCASGSSVVDGTTAASTTNNTIQRTYSLMGGQSFQASNTGVTYSTAATCFVGVPPVAGTNVTITAPHSLYVDGSTYINGPVTGTSFVGTATSASRVEFADTRASNPLPTFYYGKGIVLELKDPATFTFPISNQFIAVLTLHAWNDSTVPMFQLGFYVTGIKFRCSTGATTWSAWSNVSIT